MDTAEDGLIGLERYRLNDYDLIIIDCMMPNMDGYEFYQSIRAIEKETGDHIPIIAMTANAMQGDREKCLEAGMDEYISKPIKRDIVLTVLDKFLSKS